MPKKTKSIKKTDLKGEKPWLKKVGIYKYNLETLDKKTSFLIVCEGQTEELYFKSFPIANAQVYPVHLGCSKSYLVECAIDMASDENYDQVWCVFDFDVKGDIVNQIEDYNHSIDLALHASSVNCKFNCAYSNDSFELWFLLHYFYIDQQYHRTFYFEKLSELWKTNYVAEGKTRKFAKDIYDKLLNDNSADQSKAIERAENLFRKFCEHPYHERNPCTTVYELVNELNKYLKN
jgi:hypothetical protein